MSVMSERLDADRAHLLHPLHHPSAHPHPKVWVKGSGTVVTDAEGRDYIDGLAQLVMVASVHPEVDHSSLRHRR